MSTKGEKGRKKKKGPVKQEELENLLDLINPVDSNIFYFGIRHHSPVASFFLQKAFDAFDPDIVLIEGPADADALIPDIVHPKSKPPLAIHTYFSDKKNVLGYNGVITPKEDIPLRISAWYPFTDFSPEYVCIVEGLRRDLEVHFIDLPLELRLQFEKEIAEDKDFFDKYGTWSDRCFVETEFMDRLVKKSRYRNFNEFWNHNFEVNAINLSLEEYMKRVLTFSYELRWLPDKDTEYPAFKTILEREKYMVNQIANIEVQNPDARILVVTGAYHTVSIPFLKRKAKKIKLPKNPNCTLSPYSYKRVSELSGYTAGIESPFYQHLVWRHLTGVDEDSNGPEFAYDEVALELLLRIRMKSGKSSSAVISTADAIHALHMAKNLSSLRGRGQIAHEDLLDAIISSYIKGQIDIYGREIFSITNEFLIGNRVGWGHNSHGNPLKDDFYAQLKKNKIKIEDREKTLRCEIYKRENHRIKSHFLHQTDFLKIGFAHLVNGPNFITKENMHLLIEQWKYRWNQSMDIQFTNLVSYGTTIEDAARNMLVESIGESYQSAGEILKLVINSLQMGFLDIFEDLILELTMRAAGNQNFTETVDALTTGILLYKYRSALITKHNEIVKRFIFTAYTSAISRLKDLIAIPDEEVMPAVTRCRVLSEVSINPVIDLIDSDLILDTLDLIMTSGKEIIPQIEGAFTGIMYSFNVIDETEVVRKFKSRVFSNQDIQAAAEYLIGLFILNKTVLITSTELIEAINDSILTLPDDVFLELLPSLRKCFTAFIPREIDYISKKLSLILGIVPGMKEIDIGPEALIALQKIDDAVEEAMTEEWGL
ncbi:MAG: DUF5682 family protein [Promethearchaeota archaeon]